MKYSTEQINAAVSAGATNMASLYRSLSGKSGKAPGGFSEMIRKAVPGLFGQPLVVNTPAPAPVVVEPKPEPAPAEPKAEPAPAEPKAEAKAKAPAPTPYRSGSNYEFVALMALSKQEWKRPDLVAALMASPEFPTRYPVNREKDGKPFMRFGKPVKYGSTPEQRLNFDLEVVRDPNQQSNRGKTACTFRLDPASKGTRKENQIIRLVIVSMLPHAEIHRPASPEEKAQRKAKRDADRKAKAEVKAAQIAKAKADKAAARQAKRDAKAAEIAAKAEAKAKAKADKAAAKAEAQPVPAEPVPAEPVPA